MELHQIMASIRSITNISDLVPGNHVCSLFETDEEHRALMTSFIRQGLERNEKVIYIVDTRSANKVINYLRDTGVETEAYLESGQLIILEVGQTYMREGIFDPDSMIALLGDQEEQALNQGYSALRATGEMTWALKGLPGSERLMEYEAKLNEFFPKSKCLGVCQYDKRRFAPEILLDVLSTHPIAVIGKEMFDNFYYMPPEDFLGPDPAEKALKNQLDSLVERNRAKDAMRESKVRFRTLFENAPIGIGVSTLDGRILFFNKSATKITGYSATELERINLAEIYLNPDDRLLLLKRFRAKGFVHDQEVILKRKDGTPYCASLNIIPFTYGGEDALLTTFMDITKRKLAEEEDKENMRAQLFQAQKMQSLGRLVSGVAHEINNPLNLIMFNVPLLQKIWRDFQPILEEHEAKEPHSKYGGLTYDFLNRELSTLLSDMGMAADHIAKIVASLKSFARRSDIAEKRPMQINEAVENAIRLAQLSIRRSGIDLELDLGDELPLIVAHLHSIEQIILNLIVNAIEAIEHEEGKIQIITKYQNRKRRISVLISDNGRGIDPNISDSIFDPFVTTRQTEGGTGLGLSVAYNLVKAHDGEITFKSLKGKGTTFTISFPK